MERSSTVSDIHASVKDCEKGSPKVVEDDQKSMSSATTKATSVTNEKAGVIVTHVIPSNRDGGEEDKE